MSEIYKAKVEQRQIGTNIFIKIVNWFVMVSEFLTGTVRAGELVEYPDSIIVTSTVKRFWVFKGDETVLVLNKSKISAASTSFSKRLGGQVVVVTLFVGGFTEPQGFALKDKYETVSKKIETWVGSAD
tara:strand:- start:287 stop:670 length:384 start_codon:yes stop_codon:yes gene_type:complete